MALLLQFAGVNLINMYSNRLVTIMNEDIKKENQITANAATQVIGLCTFISAFGSIYTVQSFPRRSLYLWG